MRTIQSVEVAWIPSGMTIFLDGVAARFFRGIGAEVQFIAPFSRINFFIGANNAGKSIVLNLLASHLERVVAGKAEASLKGPEAYKGRETGPFLMAIGCRSETVIQNVVQEFSGRDFRPDYRQSAVPRAPKTLETETRHICEKVVKHECIWVAPGGRNDIELYPSINVDDAVQWTQEWKALWLAVSTYSGGGGMQQWITDTLKIFARHVIPKLPKVYLIPAKRVLGGREEAFDDLSGKGLIDHLATLQNPSWDKQYNRDKFRRINRFLQEVTGKQDAILEVPSGREHLLVHMDNKVLPLQSLGTGIHEVVLIAAFCTIYDENIICIEEPEIHLHPLLQKKLINFVINNTSSQYFIATHSSSFIDTTGANIFHVRNDGEQTRIRVVLTKNAQREILDDLGYQASDILQSNAVIWVEGPSDRIYLNHWISASDKRLQEGIHYTIMFYGGALIRHLTASDEALDEFIKLRDLNRNMAIIIDSDRDCDAAPLKPHAQRLRDEMSDGSGLVWITAGREMENYIDAKKLQAALKERHPRIYRGACKTGQYEHAFYFYRDNPKKKGERETYKDGDKVGAANLICQANADLDILDLRDRIQEIILMIHRANGMSNEERPKGIE